jgi:hypothetical protein
LITSATSTGEAPVNLKPLLLMDVDGTLVALPDHITLAEFEVDRSG